LGMTALEASLEVFDHVNMRDVRAKSVAMTTLFIDLMRPLCLEFGFALISPADADKRGSQVSFSHEHGYTIMQALIANDVIGDFRAPNIVRFGFTPLYLRFQDVQDAVRRLEAIMREERWRDPVFQTRNKVT
jgi:kynureninase